MKRNRFCLIVCYFGKLPNYFQLWLNSCRYNSNIDFLLFTDNQYHYSYPDNLKVVYTTFSEVKNQIQECFDFKICLEKPYKLCDYKPAYGYIFQHYLNGYDFWGHCDLDLIFGDIKNFIKDIDFDFYDKIFTQGHFSLYKNISRINESFMKLKDSDGVPLYKIVFTSNNSYFFDEWKGILKMYDNKEYKIYVDRKVVADISIKYNNLIPLFYGKSKRWVYEWKANNNTCKLFAFYIENGTLKKQEFMYIHLQKRNMQYQLDDDNHFYIVPNKFIDISNDNVNKFIKQNTYKIRLYRLDYIRYKFRNLKKKITTYLFKKV